MTREMLKDWTQIVSAVIQAAAFVVGAFFAAYTFWYKEVKIPAERPAALVVSSCLEELGRTKSMVLVRMKVHAVNRSDSKVFVPALWYAVRGLRIAEKGSQAVSPSSGPASIEQQTQRLNQFSEIDSADVIASGILIGSSVEYGTWFSWFNPTDETTYEELLYVPVSSYQAIRLRADFAVTKNIRTMRPNEWYILDDGSWGLQANLGSERDTLHKEAFDYRREDHKAWVEKYGFGEATSAFTLALLGKPRELVGGQGGAC